MLDRGEGGIRTPDAGITDVTVFETAAFNHSATSPSQSVSTGPRPFNRFTPCAITSYDPVSLLQVAGVGWSSRFSSPVPVPRSRHSKAKDLHIGMFLGTDRIRQRLPVTHLALTISFRNTVCPSPCVGEFVRSESGNPFSFWVAPYAADWSAKTISRFSEVLGS